jgi:hypothetical protein
MAKAEFMRAIARSERTVDLWVKAGKAERQEIDGRAYFRLAQPRNGVTHRNEGVAAPALHAALTEMTAELRALREEVTALRAALAAPVAERNEAQRGNGRVSWWRRFLYGEPR